MLAELERNKKKKKPIIKICKFTRKKNYTMCVCICRERGRGREREKEMINEKFNMRNPDKITNSNVYDNINLILI